MDELSRQQLNVLLLTLSQGITGGFFSKISLHQTRHNTHSVSRISNLTRRSIHLVCVLARRCSAHRKKTRRAAIVS